MPFEPSQRLNDVRFGIMGHFAVSKGEYRRWQPESGRWIAWYKPDDPVPESSQAIAHFRGVEEFLVNKMLFVGKGRRKDGSIPDQGKFNQPVSVRFEYSDQAANVLNIQFDAIFTYYRKYESLIVLLYAEIPEISVDQLIFLREIHWYHTEQGSWTVT